MGGGVGELRTLIWPSMSDMLNSWEGYKEQGKVIDSPTGTTKDYSANQITGLKTQPPHIIPLLQLCCAV